jgi:hypothetical protein
LTIIFNFVLILCSETHRLHLAVKAPVEDEKGEDTNGSQGLLYVVDELIRPFSSPPSRDVLELLGGGDGVVHPGGHSDLGVIQAMQLLVIQLVMRLAMRPPRVANDPEEFGDDGARRRGDRVDALGRPEQN